jgi:hypothetical protein
VATARRRSSSDRRAVRARRRRPDRRDTRVLRPRAARGAWGGMGAASRPPTPGARTRQRPGPRVRRGRDAAPRPMSMLSALAPTRVRGPGDGFDADEDLIQLPLGIDIRGTHGCSRSRGWERREDPNIGLLVIDSTRRHSCRRRSRSRPRASITPTTGKNRRGHHQWPDLPARNAGAGLALVDARQTGGQRRDLPEVPRRDHPLRPPAGRYGGPHGSRAGPGDVCVIQPGHDAWSVGDKPNVLLELATAVRETATPA